MKKIISIIALLTVTALMLSLSACGNRTADADDGSMAGVYYLVDATGREAKPLLALKDGVILEVRGDNTGKLSLMNNVNEIRFDPDTMTCCPYGEDPVPYEFDGDRITISSKKPFTMVFEKK